MTTSTEVGPSALTFEEFKRGGAGRPAAIQGDLLIEKILLMQPQSRVVIKRQAQMGEFRSSVSNELIGSTEKPFDVIIFESRPIWMVFEGEPKQEKWKETITRTTENNGLPWEERVKGVRVTRNNGVDFFAIIVDEHTKENIPVIIRLKGTSFVVAKRIETRWAKLAASGSTISSKVLRFTNLQKENDRGVYFVFDYSEVRDATDEEMGVAYNWLLGMRKSAFKYTMDDGEDTDGGAHKASTASPGAQTANMAQTDDSDDIPF